MSSKPEHKNELKDRLADQALRELIGHDRPRDMSAQILHAVENAKPALPSKQVRCRREGVYRQLSVVIASVLVLGIISLQAIPYVMKIGRRDAPDGNLVSRQDRKLERNSRTEAPFEASQEKSTESIEQSQLVTKGTAPSELNDTLLGANQHTADGRELRTTDESTSRGSYAQTDGPKQVIKSFAEPAPDNRHPGIETAQGAAYGADEGAAGTLGLPLNEGGDGIADYDYHVSGVAGGTTYGGEASGPTPYGESGADGEVARTAKDSGLGTAGADGDGGGYGDNYSGLGTAGAGGYGGGYGDNYSVAADGGYPSAGGYPYGGASGPPAAGQIQSYGATAVDEMQLSQRGRRDSRVAGRGGRRGLAESEARVEAKNRYAYFRQHPNFGLEPQHAPEGRFGDQYSPIHENAFIKSEGEQSVSTFSIDVDTASYTNIRQSVMQSRRLPPPDAVRIEEMINYFSYDYDGPAAEDERPFAADVEVTECPWTPEHRLVRVGIKGKEMETKERPLSNLVFLIDVSGSMNHPNKLPLVIEGLRQMVRELGENDRVAIVVYASAQGLALPSTSGEQKDVILGSLEQLRAGGSTAGGAGIQLAYQTALDNHITGGVNRVILCTDGDFNVGVTDTAALEKMVADNAKSDVFLTVMGFGRGNLNDAMMEGISNKGNGNYYYVDTLAEARKVLVQEMCGTLVTIAKDVKVQVEFNPVEVAGYRLIGYENRVMANEDFRNDKKDAGEIGAGHTVTALYEVVPAGNEIEQSDVKLKYQVEQPAPANLSDAAASGEMLTVRIRYKKPDEDTATESEFAVNDEGKRFGKASKDFKFASAVASFGMLLRHSQYKGNATFDSILEIAGDGCGDDPNGLCAEFLETVRQTKGL